MNDLIRRGDAVDAVYERIKQIGFEENAAVLSIRQAVREVSAVQPEPITVYIDHELTQEEYEKLRKDVANAPIMLLPSAQPESLSDAYMKAVWTWLLDYQIKAAELKGKYTPYEVLSWVANDWRKEHEGSD